MSKANYYGTPLDPTNPDHFADLLSLLGVAEAWGARIAYLEGQLAKNPFSANLQQQLATAKHASIWATNI